MAKLFSRFFSQEDTDFDEEYMELIEDLLNNEEVQSLDNFIQHKNITRLKHSLSVSYKSYRICKSLGLDYTSAARGGLLHDFFLYDWEMEDRPTKTAHGFIHPKIALTNSEKHFELNDCEKDVILKHMWPITIALPKHRESWVIVAMDKYCAIAELFNTKKSMEAGRFLSHFEVKYNSMPKLKENIMWHLQTAEILAVCFYI